VLLGASIVDLPDSGSRIILTIARVHEPRYWVRWKIERALSQSKTDLRTNIEKEQLRFGIFTIRVAACGTFSSFHDAAPHRGQI
jgi:hypothetical protein